MLDWILLIALWLTITTVATMAGGKWLKRQRIKYGGSESWDEEWTR